jgi:hypothetical protein
VRHKIYIIVTRMVNSDRDESRNISGPTYMIILDLVLNASVNNIDPSRPLRIKSQDSIALGGTIIVHWGMLPVAA